MRVPSRPCRQHGRSSTPIGTWSEALSRPAAYPSLWALASCRHGVRRSTPRHVGLAKVESTGSSREYCDVWGMLAKPDEQDISRQIVSCHALSSSCPISRPQEAGPLVHACASGSFHVHLFDLSFHLRSPSACRSGLRDLARASYAQSGKKTDGEDASDFFSHVLPGILDLDNGP